MKRKQYLIRFLILIQILFVISCVKQKPIGLYEVSGDFSDSYRNFIQLNKDNTYSLLFPSVESHHKNGFIESEGKWKLKNNEITLSSKIQPSFYDLIKVEELFVKNHDKVTFEFIVTNRYLDTVYENIPFATLGSLRLSGLNDTIFNLNKNPKFSVNWDKSIRSFFQVEDMFGFLPAYEVNNKSTNHFIIHYSENNINKLKKYDFLYKEPLIIKNDTLIYRNLFKFIKIE